MSKRARPEGRSLNDIQDEIDSLVLAKRVLKESIAAEKDRLKDRIAVLQKEMFAHPDHQKQRLQRGKEEMRALLPPYFYKVLVEQPCDSTLGALTYFAFTFDENGMELRHRIMSSTREVDMWFEHGQTFHWSIVDENGYEEGLNVKTISSKKWARRTDEEVWQFLLKANKNSVPSAFVGLYLYAQHIAGDPADDSCIADAWEWMDEHREWGLEQLRTREEEEKKSDK